MISKEIQHNSSTSSKDLRGRTMLKNTRQQARSQGVHEEPSPKRVRFNPSNGPNSDRIKTFEHYIEILRSDLDKPAMWWSRAEREAIALTCHLQIDKFRRDHLDLAQHFDQVFEYCQKLPSKETSDYLDEAEINLPSSIRGLEWGFAPSKISQRHAHIREILALQDQAQTLSPEVRDRVLSSRSLRSSRPGRVLARILGEGDARDCKALVPSTSIR